MKNFLTSILCIVLSFLITTFALKSFNNEKSINSEAVIENNNEDSVEITTKESKTSFESSISSEKFSEITSDYQKWTEYYKENIELSSDFIPVNIEGEEISKKVFLEKLKTGNYIPVKLEDAEDVYQLYNLNSNSDAKIAKSVKSISNINYSYFLKEGTNFPEFNFTDLNGNNYNSNNTKGKYLVIECWFVQCTQCIQEFPKLNRLYDRYEDQEDVLFFSIAFDKPAKIKNILSKKEFRYPVVANQKDFIKNKVQAIQYPTHVIVDKYGTIQKMVNNADSLILALDNLINGNLLPEEIM